MFAQDSTPVLSPVHPDLRPKALRSGEPSPTRVVVGPPIGDGRVAFVSARAPVPAADVLVSLHGRASDDAAVKLLACVEVRRADLWNGTFDEALAALLRETGWALTRIERRDLAGCN